MEILSLEKVPIYQKIVFLIFYVKTDYLLKQKTNFYVNSTTQVFFFFENFIVVAVLKNMRYLYFDIDNCKTLSMYFDRFVISEGICC